MSDNAGSYGQISGSVPVVGTDQVLQFQDGYTSGSTTGKITSNAAGGGDASFSTPLQPVVGEQQAPNSRPSMFTIGYYRPYFDVDTVDVGERIKDSVFPFKNDFNEKTSSNPDLYGPFWIASTLIFLTSALGNLASYLHYKSDTDWHYSINKVTWSATIFYGYLGLVPLAMYCVLRYFGMSAGLVQLWCLYGYSLFIFIPTSLVCVVPLEMVRWIIVIAAGAISTLFLTLNMRLYIKTTSEHWFIMTVVAGVLQLLLALVLKLYFFTYFGGGGSSPMMASPPPPFVAPGPSSS